MSAALDSEERYSVLIKTRLFFEVRVATQHYGSVDVPARKFRVDGQTVISAFLGVVVGSLQRLRVNGEQTFAVALAGIIGDDYGVSAVGEDIDICRIERRFYIVHKNDRRSRRNRRRGIKPRVNSRAAVARGFAVKINMLYRISFKVLGEKYRFA